VDSSPEVTHLKNQNRWWVSESSKAFGFSSHSCSSRAKATGYFTASPLPW